MKKLLFCTIGCILAMGLNAQTSVTWNNVNTSQFYSGTAGRLGVGFATGSGQVPVSALDVRGNNITLSPLSGSFNPNNKFAAMGQSGGDCNAYGFRTQVPSSAFGRSSLSMVIRSIPVTVVSGGLGFFTTREIPSIIYQGGQAQKVREDEFSVNTPPDLPKLEFRADQGTATCGDLIMSLSGATSFYKMTVFGNALATGGSWVSSDERFKTDIRTIESGLDIVQQLRGVTYSYHRETFPERNFAEGMSYGFIAQELQEVLPEAVMADEDGYLGVNYDAVIPVLVNAIQDQQAQIDALQNQLEALTKASGSLPSGSREGSDRNFGSMLEDINLEQNVPNPFRTQTEIRYFLPQEVKQASVYIFDLQGKLIRSYPISEMGAGKIIIQASELSAGMYVYTLAVNGAEVQSKRMILTE